MKKATILTLALATLIFAACGGNKEKAQANTTVEETVISDTAFQNAAAGDYKSYDGKKVITLGADFSVKVQNEDKEYYQWELSMQPQGDVASITLNSKGQDTDVKTPAQLDITEETLIVKNETYRKAEK